MNPVLNEKPEEVMTEQILLRRQEVEQLIGLSRSQIYALVRTAKFPEPVKITDGPKRRCSVG